MHECRMVPIGSNVFGIHLESREDNQIRGTITGSRIQKPIPFTSLARMILLLDEQMDIERETPPDWRPSQPGNPTFELEILFRQAGRDGCAGRKTAWKPPSAASWS